MKVGDFFDVKRGSIHGTPDMSSGAIPFVSTSTFNNGVVSHFAKLPGHKLFNSVPCLTVSVNGAPMFATLRMGEFYANDDVHVLLPNQDPFWLTNKVARLTAVASYIRKQKWRFGYGRKAYSRMKDLDLDIPAILAVAGHITQSKPKIKTITSNDIAALLARLPKGAAIQDLFDVVSRKSLAGEDVSASGSIPFISASETNNAVAGFVSTAAADYLVPRRTLSVAKDGKPMVARVQAHKWVKNPLAVPLKSKGRYTERDLAVLAALIETQAWRYSYGRKANWERMGSQVIT